MKTLRLIPVLALILATLTLTSCASLTGFLTKAVFIPANQSGPQIELVGSTDNGFPEYTLPAGQSGTVHLEFPGPYANGTGLGKTCTVNWTKVGVSDVPITTADKAIHLDYTLPGGLALGQSPVTITCRVAEGASEGQDYIARFIMTAKYDYVYWTTTKGISRAKLESDRAVINHKFITGLSGAKSVTTYNGKIYFSSKDGIGRADLDGTNVKKDWVTIDGNGVPTDLGILTMSDLDYLMWIRGGQVESMSLDGGPINPGTDAAVAAAAAGTEAFYISRSGSGRSILTAQSKPSDPIALGEDDVGGLTIADGAPYWTSGPRINTLGTNGGVRTVATPAPDLGEITFDGSRLLTVTGESVKKALLILVPLSGQAKEFTVTEPTGGIAAGPGLDPAPHITVEDAAGKPVSELSFDYPPDASPTMGQSSSIYLHNRGKAAMTLTGMSMTPGPAFMAIPLSTVVPAGKKTEIIIGFFPPGGGDYDTVLRISGNVNPTGFVEIHVKGQWRANPPRVSVMPSDLKFAETAVGSTSFKQAVRVGNGNQWSVSFPPDNVKLSGTGKDDFEITSNECQGTWGPGDACDIYVRFAPKSAGKKTATLTITSGAQGSPHSVTLEGLAVIRGPIFTVSPTEYLFAQTATGFPTDWKSFTITNTGTADLTIAAGGVTVTGTNPDQFDFTPDTCDNVTLPPGATCTLKVMFTPSSVGTKHATVRIETNAPGSPHLIAVSGDAVAPALSYAVNPQPDLIQEEGFTASTSVTVTNDSSNTVTIPADGVTLTGADASRFTIDSDACAGKELSAKQTCKIDYTFAPQPGDSAQGTFAASISITHDGAGNPLDIWITGIAQTPTGP